MLLLSDGTVMCQNSGNTGWYRLTPDIHGSYGNGTWSTLAPMNDSRRYYGSQVLRDGRVYVAGGEYGTGGGRMEIYDPVANIWTRGPDAPNSPIDSCTETLPNGNILQGNAGTDTRIYDVNLNTFSASITALGGQDEPSWVKLQDGSIITLTGTTSERFIPALNKWVADSDVPTTLFGWGYEIGAGVLLPNGKIFYIGGTNHTAIYTPWTTNAAGIYTPAGTTNAGVWTAGPDIPNNLGAVDAPAAMLVNGNVLCALGTDLNFGSTTYFYEYNYISNTFTQVSSLTGGLTDNVAPYGTTMLDLPDGSVLYSGHGSQLYLYKPGGSPLTNGMPVILSATTNLDGSFHVTGTQFTGISEGAYYGDDSQMNSDYPVARITNAAGNVLYCRTYNWSTCNLMTGTNVVTTEMTLPAGMLAGTYPLFITANGISSAPYSLTISGTPLPAVRSLAFSVITSNQMAFRWNAIGLTETGYVVQRSTNGSTFATVATLTGSTTNYKDNAVAPLSQYYYRVLGTNAVGLGNAPQPIFAASSAVVPVPAPWQAQDIGAVLGAGASGTNPAGFTVIGSGAGLGGQSDQFQFVAQPVAGDMVFTARVLTNQNTAAGALAGVMIRNSLDVAAADVLLGYAGGNLGVSFQSRASAGATAVTLNGATGLAAPYWVRLVRTGNSFTGYTSPDGTVWTLQGSVSIPMEPVVYAGLVVSSGAYNLLNSSAFDSVSLTGSASPNPIPLADWKLDETTGTTALDSRGNFSGTYNNVVLGLSGASPVTGTAVGFNGASANIQVPALNLNSNVLTVTAWVNRNGNQNAWSGIFFERGSSADGLHFGTANELRYTWNNSASTYNASSGLVPPSGVWTFVALVIEPSRARIYMLTNGVLAAWTNNVANPVQPFEAPAFLGQDSTSSARCLNGQLDEVQLFNQALTPAQLTQLASTPLIAFSSPSAAQEFLPPASVNLAAAASGTNGHLINLVQFFQNGNLVGQAVTPPYTNTVTNLAIGTYAFSARMFYDSGLVVSADPVSVVVETAPVVPQNVVATALASNVVYVTWLQVSGADGYLVKSNGVVVATTSAAANYYVNSSLAAGSTSCYTVAATNQVGSSAASASVCATTPVATAALAWDAGGSPSGPQDGSDNWGSAAATWWGGSGNVVWSDAALAIFGTGTATNCLVTLLNDVTPGGLVFNANSGGAYNLTNGGGGLNLSGTLVAVANGNATISAPLQGSGQLIKTGPGTLTLTAASTNYSGAVSVNGGTLEVQNKSGDVPYTVARGATLRIGYSTGGGYSPALTLFGNGLTDPSGLYILGGKNFQCNGGLLISNAPTTIRAYGSGNATIQGFDVNGAYFLKTVASASGSVVESNVNFSTGSYGYKLQVDAGSSNAVGDLTIKGVITGSAGNETPGVGFQKFGTGSLVLSGASTFGQATAIRGGSIILAANDCLPTGSAVFFKSSSKLLLNGYRQTVSGLGVQDGTAANAISGGSTNLSTLTVNCLTDYTNAAVLGGTNLYGNNLALVKASVGRLVLTASNTATGGTLVNGGTLEVNASLASTNVTVQTGATLSGTGPLKGALIVQAGGVLAPGIGGIGTLKLTNTLTLAGTALMEINKSAATSDKVQGIGSLTYGGTLVVTNLAGTLAAGDSYTLFTATNYSGSFSSILLPALTGNLAWDTSKLGVNGSLSVGLAPSVALVPATTNVTYGLGAILTAAATGTAPLGYQWFYPNANPIPGATSATLTLVAPSVIASGNYVVVVTNAFGRATNGCVVTVSPTTLTVSVNSTNRLYGAANPVFTASYAGFVNGETSSVLSGSPLLSTSASATSPVGNYPLTGAPGSLSATNYSFSFPSGTLTVGAAPLAITASSTNKIYGQNLTFSGSEFSSTGLVNGDTVASVSLLSSGATNPAVVGGYPIVPGNAQGARLTNYVIGYSNGTLTVNPAMLVVIANDTNRLYGAANPGFTASYTNFVNGDTAAILIGVPALTTTAQTNSPVGGYPITASVGTLGATNYTFSFSNGTVTVTSAALTITAGSTGKLAGQDLVFTGTEFLASGLVNNDAVTLVTLASAGTTNTASPGNYPIVASAAQGTGLDNYVINYVNGNLAVSNASVRVPIITGASVSGGGSFALVGSGIAGQTYVWMSAADLQTGVWTPVATNMADTNGLIYFLDSGTTNSQKFYRLLSP